MFLDDGCGKGDSLQNAKRHSLFVQSSLSNAGFAANSTKSLWDSTQALVWLGLNWDLVSGSISISDRRISNFIALVDKFLQSAPYVAARDCASIDRRSCYVHVTGFGNLTRLKTRFLYKVIESDASNVACGAFLVGTNEVSHRMWSPCEAAKSSAWRELKAIHFALTSFKTLVQGKPVKWHSDNQVAVHIVDVGSPHPELHSSALDIFDFCRT